MSAIPENILENMQTMAKTALNNAHAVYSGYKVGACIITKAGNLYAGCNVENASYPCSQCAEAGAIGTMVANGETAIRAIMVMADYDRIEQICTPCGACRQKISEFSNPDSLVYLANTHKIYKVLSMQDLLPYSFNKESLKI